MADEFYIIKDTGIERWSDDRAVGTLVVSGVPTEVAIATVKQARALFREFDATAISSKAWVLLSEELRRGELGAAAKIVMSLPRQPPAGPPAETPPGQPAGVEWDAAALRALTAQTIARTRRTDAYAHVQASDAYQVATIGCGDPVLGLIAARHNELLDTLTLRAGRDALPLILGAYRRVLADVPGGVKPEAYAALKRRLYALTSVSPLIDVAALDTDLARLIKRASFAGVLHQGALTPALSLAGRLFCPLPPILVPPGPLAPYQLTPEEVGQTRERPRIKVPFAMPPSQFARPNKHVPKPGEDPRDAPPAPVHGEELTADLAYARWTAVEWAPFIRPDDHSLFCHEPIRDAEGDRAKVVDVPGGYSLSRAQPKALALRHITSAWVPRAETYWQPYPEKLQFVPTKPQTWVDMFVIETRDTDEPSDILKDLERRINEELDKDRTREKLEEALKKGIDSLLGDVTVFGVNIGAAAAGASKLLASALIELVAWLVDHVFETEAFQEVIVTHKTMYADDRLHSWVTWSTRDRDTGEMAPFDPRTDDANQPSLPTLPLSKHTGFLRAAELGMAGIYWTAESKVPDRLPSQSNPLFLLSNAAHGEIYWPPDMTYGGHVFLPVRARQSDAVYCLAVRTEVRAVHVETP